MSTEAENDAEDIVFAVGDDSSSIEAWRFTPHGEIITSHSGFADKEVKMVTLAHPSEDGDIFAIPAEIHTEGRDEAVGGADGFVVGRKNDVGNWNFEFQGPESLDSQQRQACINAASVFCAEMDKPAEPAPDPATSPDPLLNPCPSCGALPGDGCTTASGNPAGTHASR